MTKRDYNPSKAHQDAVGEHPIEEAIGDRAKTSKDIPKIVDTEEFKKLAAGKIHDVPSPSEMLSLEELNRRTEERLQEDPEFDLPGTTMATHPIPVVPIIPVSKPDHQPVIETSSEASPPQGSEKEFHPIGKPIPGIKKLPSDFKVKHTYETGIAGIKPAEDRELVALKKYILEDGFVLSTVAFHIVSLCAEPLTTPSTTTWDFIDRALIPNMVLVLLNEPGYLEGIWPSLKIVMGSNAGNSAWTAGIATTIAFFDVIRTLPHLKELKK